MSNCSSSTVHLWRKANLDSAGLANKEKSSCEQEVSWMYITQSKRTYKLLSPCVLGLAEGYLGSDDLNKEKFIANFFLKNANMWQEDEERNQDSAGREEPWRNFWQGPRDRLYKYGNVRKYLTYARSTLNT